MSSSGFGFEDPTGLPSPSLCRDFTVPRSKSPPLSVTISAVKYLSNASGVYSSASDLLRGFVSESSICASFVSSNISISGSKSLPSSPATSSFDRSSPILSLIDLSKSFISSFRSVRSVGVRAQNVLRTIGLADFGSRNAASPPP